MNKKSKKEKLGFKSKSIINLMKLQEKTVLQAMMKNNIF